VVKKAQAPASLRHYNYFAIPLAHPPLLCFIPGQREVLGNISAPAQWRSSGCRCGDVLAMGRDVRPRGLAPTSSSPAQGRPEPRPQLFSHSIPEPLVALRVCGRGRALDARGSGPRDLLRRFSFSSRPRLPAAAHPRPPCGLKLSRCAQSLPCVRRGEFARFPKLLCLTPPRSAGLSPSRQ